MWNFDMISFGDGDSVVESNESCLHLMEYIQKLSSLQSELRIIIDLMPQRSDHVPFLENNVPAIACSTGEARDYPYYHTTKDTIENVHPTLAIHLLKLVSVSFVSFLHFGIFPELSLFPEKEVDDN